MRIQTDEAFDVPECVSFMDVQKSYVTPGRRGLCAMNHLQVYIGFETQLAKWPYFGYKCPVPCEFSRFWIILGKLAGGSADDMPGLRDTSLLGGIGAIRNKIPDPVAGGGFAGRRLFFRVGVEKNGFGLLAAPRRQRKGSRGIP